MTMRSQSAIDFIRTPNGTTYDPGGGGLRINPNRTRQPRSGSIVSLPVSSPTEDLATTEADGGSEFQAGEKQPLIERRESYNSPDADKKSTFSHSGSLQDLKRAMITNFNDLLDVLWAPPEGKKTQYYLNWLKIFVLFSITVLCCAVLTLNSEEEEQMRLTVVPGNGRVALASGLCSADTPNIRLKLQGPFKEAESENSTGPFTTFRIGTGNNTIKFTVNMTALAYSDEVEFIEDFHCETEDRNTTLTVESEIQIPISWMALELSWQLENEVVYAFLILGFVYVLIIFELMHRTLVALVGALAALAVLSALNERPSLDTIIQWIDMETLTLLFGMMIIVAIFSETGFFDYSALVAYRLAQGRVWRLITLLCIFSAVVSAFLDNVTTILLMAPVTIRLCEVLNLEPRKILMAEVLFSNIGGTATAIGDPPNVIIVGALGDKGITFSTFTLHMFPGIVFISFLGYGMIRLYYRKKDTLENKDPPDITEMKNEISMWRRAANRQHMITREETLMRALFLQKAVETEHIMNRNLRRRQRGEAQDRQDKLRKLEKEYYIKDFPLLFKSGLVLLVVIIFLFTYSFVDAIHLDIGWIAVLGAIWLLVLADVEDIEGILHKVEWSTLLFFAGLFVLMEALAELGMIKTIGDGIADVIKSVDEDNRLAVALLIILWVSAIASSFIDNIPYTTAMVPVLQALSENEELELDLLPLVIALAFGACLGGNGTLIGASCNVVCAGIAEQHGYGFSFREFFKIGFPMMLVTTAGATVYTMICHVALKWNEV